MELDLVFGGQEITIELGESTRRAEAAADRAELAAATAESLVGPTYPNTAAGLAATSEGGSFAVDNGDGTVTIYTEIGGLAVEQRTLATTAYLASTAGAGAIGLLQGGTVQDAVTWVTPLNFGAVGDGVADDTAAIDDAMASGKHVLFPAGYTFLTDTDFGHAYSVDGQIVQIDGDLIYSGTRHDLDFSVNGFWCLLFAFEKARITLRGSGRLLGARTGGDLEDGDAGSGVLFMCCPDATIEGVRFADFIEVAIKVPNCPGIHVDDSIRAYYIRNTGTELRSYAANPYEAWDGPVGEPWTEPVPGPSGYVSGHYEFIDDDQHGVGNGCGIDFSCGASAPKIGPLTISGIFLDVNRAIFAENNYYASGSRIGNITIDKPKIEGNIRGAAECETYGGIGLVDVNTVSIVAPDILNQGNFVPSGGAKCYGIVLSGSNSTDIEIIGAQITDDSGDTNRTDYGIIINFNPARVTLRGGSISGMSDGPLNITGAPTSLRVDSVRGLDDDYSWGGITRYSFSLQNVPAGVNSDLLSNGQAGIDVTLLPCAGRVVAQSVRCSAVTNDTFDIRVFVGGVEQTGVTLDETSFGGGAQATKKISAATALQGASGAQLKVRFDAGAGWTATNDVQVDVFIDHSLKL